MSADVENSCRICRGEATAAQPLLHPCKCRGSIKYIHEECLFEWLKHSNKSTEKCDICNTPYRFKTIYDPAMPQRIPILLVWSKLIHIISSTVVKSLSILLYILCILFQVPLYWKFSGRIYTWAIDGTLPKSNPTFPEALLYGEFDFASYLAQFQNLTMFQLTLLKARLFIDCTFFSGVRYILIAVIIHIALFVEHEWVVRDEGYTKLLLRKVGNEPRTKLADMLEAALQRIRNGGNNDNVNANPDLQNLDVIARALDDLQDETINLGNPRRHELLQRAMEGGDFDGILERHINNANPETNDEVETDNERRTIFVRPGMDATVENTLNGSTANEAGSTANDEDDSASDDDDGTHVNLSDAHENQAPIDGAIPAPVQRPVHQDRAQARAQALAAHNRAVARGRLALQQAQAPAHIEDPRESSSNQQNTDSEDDENDPNDTHLNLNQNNQEPELPQVAPVAVPQAAPRPPQGEDIPQVPQQAAPAPRAPDNFVNDQDLDDEAVDAGGNGGFADFLELFGVTLNIKTPILLMLVCDFVISAYLFVIYLIPHMLGNLFVSLTGAVFKLINTIVVQRLLPHVLQIPFVSELISYQEIKTGSEFLDYTFLTLNQYIIQPFSHTFYNLFIESKYQYSLTERIILLTIGYSIIAYFVYKFMSSLVAGDKPVVGTSRKIYKVLFEVSSTAKVFLIFAIEIFFFPVYCGWLLDFCVAPLFLQNFTKKTDSGVTTFILLLTSQYPVLQIPYLRVFLFWGLGTLYMLFFALFVGMVRGSILRPGVLFFIRSPDDPNARLIHDALVKPLSLQLFRIYLSAKVYTGFILVGIGSITWGFRYVVSTPKDVAYNVFLPIQLPSLMSIGQCLVIMSSFTNTTLITKYSQKYWTRAFELSAHKLRLSHIILGKPISQERGYVVYRNTLQKILGVAQPDYSKPVTYREAMTIFKENSQVQACFVPDGNYVRAPANDTVSRKYVKKLFVPVTKDDKLLSTNGNATARSGYETPTSDEDDEVNTDNAYSIVYRPPYFRARCLGLIALLWVFAVVLFLSIAVLSLVLGRPIVRAVLIVCDVTYWPNLVNIDWRLADFLSIACGFQLQSLALSYIDHQIESDAGSNEVLEENAREQDAARAAPQVQPPFQQPPAPRVDQPRQNALDKLKFLFVGSCLFCLWMVWVASVHHFCIEVPVLYHAGVISLFERYNLQLDSYMVDKRSLLLHFVASFWTIFTAMQEFVAYIYSFHPLPSMPFLKQSLRKVCGYLMAVVIPGGFFVLFSNLYPPTRYYAIEVYVWPVLFVAFALVNGSISATQMFDKINEQVKNEKFVRGRAVENIDE